jgi:hypothetical protein
MAIWILLAVIMYLVSWAWLFSRINKPTPHVSENSRMPHMDRRFSV